MFIFAGHNLGNIILNGSVFPHNNFLFEVPNQLVECMQQSGFEYGF